jgi:hypothetical protein
MHVRLLAFSLFTAGTLGVQQRSGLRFMQSYTGDCSNRRIAAERTRRAHRGRMGA